jgi:hypothetical protein
MSCGRTLEEPSVQKPYQLATWDSEKDFWENGEDIFGHSDVYSETWPTSGMTVNGVAYELPTWERPTDDSESSSLLPTVTTSESTGPGNGPNKTGGDNLRTIVALLPTPTVGMTMGGSLTRSGKRSGELLLPGVAKMLGETLLPTPTTRDHKDNTIRREPHRPNDTDTLARALTGVNTPGLFVDGKPCMEPPLPL